MSERRIVLVNTKGTSAKVWGYDSFVNMETGEIQMIWFWGTVGKYMHELQNKSVTYRDRWEAHDIVRDRIDGKTSSGYIIVDRSEYFKAVEEFRERLNNIMVPKEEVKENLLQKAKKVLQGG